MLRLQLIILGILCAMSFSLAQGIKGTITDEDHQSIPFTTIYIKKTTTGTTTNELGEYEILLSPGKHTIVFQGLGFQKQEITVDIDASKFVTRDIVLKKQAYQIKEVRVFSGGEDPAYPIMRKAISLAPYYLRQTGHYKAEVYLKGSLYMKKIPWLMQKMMKAEAEGDEIQLESGKTYTLESMNEIVFDAPDTYEHTVISTRSTFPGSEENNVMGYMTSSFYAPSEDLAISPLSPKAFSHYKFVYEGFFYDGDVAVNKIKVTPRRKSQQLYTGYIYIVDNLWNIHSIDVTNDAFFGIINIKQVFAPVKEKTWLPISHRFKVEASIMGIKADFRYAGSVKYSDIALNAEIPVPNVLKQQYAAAEILEQAEKVIEEEEPVTSKNQQKIEALLAKEEMSTRDMIRLNRLIEKEAVEQEESDESLEIVNNYKFKHKKDTVQRDSSYWDAIRPIPLTKDEFRSFEVKDSLKLAKMANDTTKTTKKEKSVFSKIMGGSLGGKTFYAVDSTLRIRYNGLLGLSQVGFNAVDGWNYKQSLSVRYIIDSTHTLNFRPMVQYAFDRKKLMWEGDASYSFIPDRRGHLGVSFGQVSKDFNKQYGIDPTLNMFAALFFKDHYMKLYQRDYISVNHRIDLIHGLRLRANISYNYYQQLENNTKFSFFKRDTTYAANIPINPDINDSHLANQSDFKAGFELSYTPQLRYRVHKGRKYMAGSKYPTFTLGYQRGIKNVFNSDSDYELIHASIDQDKQWGIFHAFNWKVNGGYFTRNKQMHFSQFKHFNTSEIPLSFKKWNNAFVLLEDYQFSTNEWYAQGHATFTSPYLLLKYLPVLSNRLWLENVYASHLMQPQIGNYTEFGYGISQIFFMGSVGVFAGFEDGQYSRWGFRVSLTFE